MRHRLVRALPLVVLLVVLSGQRLLPAHAATSITTTGVYTVTETGPDALVVGQAATYTITYSETIPLLALPLTPAITITAGASAITITSSSTFPAPCLPFSQAASPVSYSAAAQCSGLVFLDLGLQPTVTFTITLTPTSAASGGLTVASSETNFGGPGVLVSLTTPVSGAATVTLTATPATATPGQLVTFTATVGCAGGTPTGTVTFASNGTALATVPVSGGSATVTLPVPAAGLLSVVATYNGDPFCSPGSSAAPSVTGNAPIVISNPAVTLGIVVAGCGSTTPSALTAFGFLSATPVTAVPCPGSVFVGWTGGPCSGTRINPCDIAATGLTTITATFAP